MDERAYALKVEGGSPDRGKLLKAVRAFATSFTFHRARVSPRQGRPATYPPEERAGVVAAALRRPREVNPPFNCLSLDRLTAYLHEQKQMAIKRSRVGEIPLEEGLRWRKQNPRRKS